MSGFRDQEVISYADFAFILLMTAMLLAAAYFLLKKLQPSLLEKYKKKSVGNIELVAHRDISVLGEVFVISVEHEQFLVIKTKAGVSTTPLSGAKKIDTGLPEPDLGNS